MKNPFETPNDEQLSEIRKQLTEDEEKTKHYLNLFKKWLKCQGHLSSEIDDHFISNFIRLCKMDLKRAKTKLEECAISMVRHRDIYQNGELNQEFFRLQNVHKKLVLFPKLTPDGCRVIFGHENDAEARVFDFQNLVKYAVTLALLVLMEDTNAGIKGIFDFKNVTLQHVKQLDLKMLADAIAIVTRIFPFRLRGCYVINLPSYVQTVFQWVITLLPEKLRKRMFVLKNPEDLLKHFPKEMLPEDCYGMEKSTELLGEKWMECLLDNKSYYEKLQTLKLIGQVPKTKGSNIIEMDGSFRKLCID